MSSGARTQPVLALIWTHATFNEAAGALPVCRANDPRWPLCVTGGDALQASVAVLNVKLAALFKRKFIFSALICNAIDGDVLNVMTTGLLSDFCQGPPPQIRHRK